MSRYLLAVCVTLFSVQERLFAQDATHTVYYDFILYKGGSGDQDLTEWLVNSKFHTIFYSFGEDSVAMLSNVSPILDTQSFGRLTTTKEMESGLNEEGFETEIYYLDWEYINTYDDESGIAKVKAIITQRADATYLILYIMPNDFEMITYYGVTKTTPDL